jgi:hypothetical protein
MTVDYISLATTPVYLYDKTVLVSQGTGFFYIQQYDGFQVVFLVTNFHVLTGSSPVENIPPMGDNISFQFHLSEAEPGKVKIVQLPLFTKSSKPIWIGSPSCIEADLAVIPLVTSLSNDCAVHGISEDWTNKDIKVRPTTPVTLIGYPHGFYDKKNGLPVWKTGSVASEPDIDFEGKPLFLVDVSAFPGMSGSPVFAVSHGAWEAEDGRLLGGNVRKFLGIFASLQMLVEHKYLETIIQDARLGIVHSESLEIGHVWKSSLITETVKSVDVEKYREEILRDLPK